MKKFYVGILTLGCIMGSFFAFSGRDKVEASVVQPVTLVGQIGVYGNEPHTWLGFVDQKGVEYALDATPEMIKDLRSLQGVLLEISGFLETVPEDQLLGYQILSGGTIEVEEFAPYEKTKKLSQN